MAALVGTEDITEDITAAPDLAVVIGPRWVVVCTIITIIIQWAAECGTVLPIAEDAVAACSP